MPETNVNKETADKFTHMADAEPERDGLDYGPDDDFMEIVTSVPADMSDKAAAGDTLEESYSSEGKAPDDTMDMGGENYSQDVVERTKEPEPEPEPEDKPAEAEAKPDAEDKPAKDKSPAQKRIDIIIKERNEARQKAAYYQGLAEGKPAAGDGADPAGEAQGDKPKLEDFESYEDYTEALYDFKDAERDRANATAAAEEQVEKTQALMKEKIDKGFEKYDDFEAVAFADGVAINDAMIEILADCENTADIVYTLGKDPAESKRISRMGKTAMALELGKLDATLKSSAETTPETKPVKTVSDAPAPINPVNTGAAETTRKAPEDMSMDEYINWRTRGGKRKV